MRWVVFDLGGVVVRVASSWQECAVRAQISFHDRPELADPVIQFSALRDYQAGRIELDGFLANLGAFLGCPPADAAKAHGAMLVNEYEGLSDLAAQIRADGGMLSCLSNTNEPHVEVMLTDPRFATVGGFDKHLFSHLVRLEKPDPAIYHWACETLEAGPSEIIFFDDSEPNIRAAQELGWAAYWIQPAVAPALQIRKALLQEGFALGGSKN